MHKEEWRYAKGITFPPGTSTIKHTVCESTVLCLQTCSLAALCFATAPLHPSPIANFQIDHIIDCILLTFFYGVCSLSPFHIGVSQPVTLFTSILNFVWNSIGISMLRSENLILWLSKCICTHTHTKSFWKSVCSLHFVQAINILQREYPGRTAERCSEFLMAIKMY